MVKVIYFLFLSISLNCSAMTVAFFGDSITYGYLVNKNERYSEVTQEILKQKNIHINIINKGVNCQITKDTLKSIKETLKTEHFDIAVIASGINDASIKAPYSDIRKNFDSMIKLLLDQNIHVIIGIVEPKQIIPNYEKDFEKLYIYINKTYPVRFFPFLTTDILKFYCLDIVHPNPNGHRIIADRLASVIENY